MKLTICFQIANTYGIVFVVHYPITQMDYLSHLIHYQTQMFDSLHLDISTYSYLIDQPQATSSPKPTINVNKKQKVAKKKASQRLTILNINCQLVKSKVPDLHQVIHQVKPDIIVGTESWLTSDITC